MAGRRLPWGERYIIIKHDKAAEQLSLKKLADINFLSHMVAVVIVIMSFKYNQECSDTNDMRPTTPNAPKMFMKE